MTMVTLYASVEGERLSLMNQPVMASGTVLAFQIKFDFDETWEGYGKIALFWDEEDEVYAVQVVDGIATVPHEVLVSRGKLKFGVYGTNDAYRIVSQKVIYDIADGAYTSVATESVEPTPDLLEQIEAALGRIDDTIEELRDMARGSRSLVALENYSPEGTYLVGAVVLHDSKIYECIVPIRTPEQWTAWHWAERNVDYFVTHLTDDVPRCGVSGVGGSSPTLTRLWDAADMDEPVVSTDVVAGGSPFDNIAPFNRRKCVGSWSAGTNGKAVFTVNAYYGDPDYAEDGSMGDYVAVEVDPFYYYEKNGVLGVSAFQYPGYTIHPVCVDNDGKIRKHTYLPCYALTLKNGHAVSLPGGLNMYGGYKDMRDYAVTYENSGAAASAIIEPSAVWHYEWLLMTIEFATMNMQSVMTGATSMRYKADDVIISVPAANKIVIGAGGAQFVVGQNIMINVEHSTTASNEYQNQITAIEKCDSDGTLNDQGSYYLITYNGTDRSESIVVDSWKVGSRAWMTGATSGYAPGVGAVLGHTGSPVATLGGKYPMRYRWRENVYGNQNMTCLDLADIRVEDGDSFHLDWYHLPDPRVYTPYGNFSKSDLQNPAKGWVKLGVTTPKEGYVNGYITEMAADPAYPCVKIPRLTGGGSNVYYCDYASLVTTSEVRAVRRGGYISDGSSYGPCYVTAYYAPSYSHWAFGAALFFIQ